MRKPLPPGWREGTVAEFLGLTPAEEAVIEIGLKLADLVKARRAELGLTQKELAERMGTTQPHVCDLEHGASRLDTVIRAFLALGGSRAELAAAIAET